MQKLFVIIQVPSANVPYFLLYITTTLVVCDGSRVGEPKTCLHQTHRDHHSDKLYNLRRKADPSVAKATS